MRTRRYEVLCLLLFLLLTAGTALANKSGVGPTVLSLPAGPGSLGGVGENVQANLNMGLMSYPIRIGVPKGRGQFTPSIGISYSSSAGAGSIGIGWNLNAGGSISRLTVRGLPTYTNEDRFYSGGELVKIPNSPFYRARMEGGFVRYQWKQAGNDPQKGYWIAEYPDGSKGYFGATSDGKLDLDSQVYGTKGTFCWKLRTQVDRNGNRIEYAYFKDGTQAYLDQISWVFDQNNKSLYQISLRYEGRPDPISDGKPGFDLITKQRLKEITITSQGQRFRSYLLTFEDQSNPDIKLSRLAKVERYGRDPKQAHPVVFTMKYSEATFSKENSRLVTMPTALGIDFANGKADFLDINGDGLPDVIDTSKSNHVFHINTLTLSESLTQKGSDFPSSQQVINPKATSGAELSNASVQMIDYNGDGFTDMVDAVNKAIYINKGKGQWETGSGSLASFPVNGKDANMRFFDYNGDKAIDVISSNGSVTTYWVSDGKGNWKQVDGRPNLGASVSQDKIRFIDINGDGLNDAVQILKSSMRYKKYLGYGNWSDWITLSVPDIGKYELDTKAQFNDINGDGMADMVAFLGSSIVYFVNRNGVTFAKPERLDQFDGQSLPNSTGQSVRIADMNGNGSRDIVWINSSGKVTYLELFDKRPNLLIEIANGIGQRIEVAYGSSAWHRLRDEAKGRKWKNLLPMSFPVVNQIKTWAETDGTTSPAPIIQRIEYHDGYYDGIEKKFRGFREVDNILVGDDSAPTRLDQMFFNVGDQDIYFHGKLERQVITDSKGKVFDDSTMKYEECSLSGVDKGLDPPVRFICLRWMETLIKEGEADSSLHRTTRREYTYDGFGNVIIAAMLGRKDKSGDEIYTKSTYITPKDPKSASEIWNLQSRAKIEKCDKEDGPCGEVRFYFDGDAHKGLPLGQRTKGNVTRVAIRVGKGDSDQDFFQARSYKFNSYGQHVERKISTGALRSVEWDERYQLFPIKETYTDGKTTFTASTLWNYELSRVTQSTDFNGNTSYYRYDFFGRLLSISQPGDAQETPSLTYEYQLKAPISRVFKRYRSVQGGTQDRLEVQCFDGLGRKFAMIHKVDDKTYQVSGHTLFNARGTRKFVWETYQQSDDSCRMNADDKPKLRVALYDSKLRLLRATNRDGSFTRSVYKPLMAVSYDENDNDKDSPHYNTPRTIEVDGLGRSIRTIDIPQKGEQIVRAFAYSAAHAANGSKIVEMTLPDGSKKEQEYDLMGRLIKIIDPDRSEITMTYDAYNQMDSLTNARGLTTLFSFDAFGRRISQMQKDKPETKVTYTYDKVDPSFPEATQLKGKLTRIDMPSGYRLFSYDTNGNCTASKMMFMGVMFAFQYAFDNNQIIKQMTLPDGRKLSYEYDGIGRLRKVPGLMSEISYNDLGLFRSWKMANGVTSSFGYDQRNRIKSYEVGKLMQMSFTYDKVGNALTVAESHGEDQYTNQYEYDALDRMTKASLPGQEVLNFRFDQLDNVTQKISSLADKSPVHIGDYTYDKDKIHAASQAGKHKLTLDKSGNTLRQGEWSFTWDYLNRMTSASHETKGTMTSLYDGNARRIAREENGVYTFYPLAGLAIRGAGLEHTLSLRHRPVAIWRSQAFAATFYDDLAPLKDEKTPAPDGKITVADAWVYHASRNKMLPVSVRKRPIDLDLTRTMMVASLDRLLEEKAESKTYLHADQVGSVRAVTDEEGQVLARYHYYPYGALRKQEGQWTRPIYMGAEWDRLPALYYFGTRSMSPTIGRWMRPDPAFDVTRDDSGEFNSYGMFNNNPIRFADPSGTTSEEAIFAYTGIAATGISTLWGLYKLFTVSKKYKGSSRALYQGLTAVSVAISSAGMGVGIGMATSNDESGKESSSKALLGTLAALSVVSSGISLAKFEMRAKAQGLKPASMRSKTATYFLATSVTLGLGAAALSVVGDGQDSTTQIVALSLTVGSAIASFATKVALDKLYKKAVLSKKADKAVKKITKTASSTALKLSHAGSQMKRTVSDVAINVAVSATTKTPSEADLSLKNLRAQSAKGKARKKK